MVICNRCKKERIPKTKLFKKWKDHQTQKTKYFCGACYEKAKFMRRQGITMRSALYQAPKQTITELEIKHIQEYEKEKTKKT
ncbi:MAG TPA: hypothetical protein VJN02_12955 [Gammaproteobacteria bacterium]|nr:hypothetical protein [Gammaproteobacteria bacterium]